MKAFFEVMLAILIPVFILAIIGCGQKVGPVGPQGPQGEPGETIQGPPGFPGPECAFFCHGKHQLYIRCDGHADIVVTGIGCAGEGQDD
jgi:hypothetical protein